jgi:cysteinyl-tRNA synthetase
MSKKYLGLPFDIHGGGADLVFPHHENERAQSEAADGVTFANHWMHGGMLQVNGEKMSKSLNNFFLLRDILETVDPNDLRFLMLQTHYRSPLDFSDERVDEAGVALGRIKNAVAGLDWALGNAGGQADAIDAAEAAELVRSSKLRFMAAMDDDFNSPKALGEVFDLVAAANTLVAGKALTAADAQAIRPVRDLIVELMGVFGIDLEAALASSQAESAYPAEVVELAADLAGFAGGNPEEAVDALLAARAEARAAKDWARADAVRDGMAALGFTIKDTPQGAQVDYAPVQA